MRKDFNEQLPGGGRFGKTQYFLNPNLGNLGREPREKMGRVRLLDFFAGFGSIPLEAVRLSVGEVVAAELLLTAYVFLKRSWSTQSGLPMGSRERAGTGRNSSTQK